MKKLLVSFFIFSLLISIASAAIVETVMCTDSDDGQDYYTQGSASGCDGFSVTSRCVGVDDACLDSLRLREAFCDESQLVYADVTCPVSCDEGACVYEGQYPSSEEIKAEGSQQKFEWENVDVEATKMFLDGKTDEPGNFEVPAEAAVPETIAAPQPVGLGCDNGCFNGDKCLSYGYRLRGSYCDVSGQIRDHLKAGSGCDNDFECSSNKCMSKQCVNSGLIEMFIDWANNFFGGK